MQTTEANWPSFNISAPKVSGIRMGGSEKQLQKALLVKLDLAPVPFCCQHYKTGFFFDNDSWVKIDGIFVPVKLNQAYILFVVTADNNLLLDRTKLPTDKHSSLF